MDCSPPGSSVHGILQARILEWAAMPSSRGSSLDRTQGSNPGLLGLLQWQLGSLPLAPSGKQDQTKHGGKDRVSINHVQSPLPVSLQFFSYYLYMAEGVLCSSNRKESACNARDQSSIPGSGRSSGERNGNPLRYSCLENSTDREAWRATVHGVTKSQTQVSN